MTEDIKKIFEILGIEKRKQFLPLEQLKEECIRLGFKTGKEYYARYEEIINAPSNPDKTYKDWISWKHLLGKIKIY